MSNNYMNYDSTPIISEFTRILKDGKLDKLVNHLSRFNKSIDIYFIYYTTDYDLPNYREYICSIYNRELSLDYYETKKSQRNTKSEILPRDLLIEFLVATSDILFNIYNNRHLDVIDQITINWSDELRETLDNAQYYSPHVIFYIDDIEVFGICSGNTSEEYLEIGYNKKYYMSLISNYSDFINMENTEWYQHLEPVSQMHIKAGTILLNEIVGRNIDLIDYSPLTLNFLKAIENETHSLIKKYLKEFLKLAEMIIQESRSNGIPSNHICADKKDDREYVINELAKKLFRFRDRYNPSGVLPLYYILRYFLLPENLNLFAESNSICSHSLTNKLKKNYALFDRIKEIGKNRNDLIHSKIVESSQVFLMIYTDIFLALNLIADIKKSATD